MQKDIITVTDIEAARALRGVGFLPQFLEPASPSDVAKQAKVAANLVHHHAKRCLELGLLFEAKRQGGKVFYQTAARNFKVPRGLLENEDKIGVTIRNLSSAFMQAYEKSDRLTNSEDYEYDVYGYSDPIPQLHDETKPDIGSGEARPSHFQAITVRLSPSSYQELVRKIAVLLNKTKPEPKEGVACTIGLMAFEGLIPDEFGQFETESRFINSFMTGDDLMPASSD
jgi:hypothetical protein